MATTYIYDDVPRYAPKSTGKERDSETGLDYFGARYYNSTMASFFSPDVAPPSFSNPQSWNRYSYVLNNPLRSVDPDGELEVEIVRREFNVTFTDKDRNGNTVTTTVNVEVTGTLVFNDDGTLSSASFSAQASNTSGDSRDFTKKELDTIGSTIGNLFQESARKDLGPQNATRGELVTAVSAKESTLGILAPMNPLQLSRSSGIPPRKADISFNISHSLDLLAERVKKYDLFKALAKYNAAGDPEGYARKVTQYYDQIRGSETKDSFKPKPPAGPGGIR